MSSTRSSIYPMLSTTGSGLFSISDGSGTPNWIFGYVPGISQKMGLKGKLCKDIFFIFTNFLAYLMILQSFIAPPGACSTLKNHQICQKLGKNGEKPCSICLKPMFRVLDLSLFAIDEIACWPDGPDLTV